MMTMIAHLCVWVVKTLTLVADNMLNVPLGYRQCGVSMISLMIGLLVSMVAILAITSMHKSLIRVTIDSKTSALQDSSAAVALMQLQLDLHNAGYGINSAGSGTVIATTLSGVPTLLWRYLDDESNLDSVICRGVQDQPYTDDTTGKVGRELIDLTTAAASNSDCSLDDDLSAITWADNEKRTVAQFRNHTTPLFDFEVETADCVPYGLGIAESHFLVTVSAESSAGSAQSLASDEGEALDVATTITPIKYKYCLANTHL